MMPPGSPLNVRRRSSAVKTPTRFGRGSWSLAGMVHGVSRPRSQLVVKVLIAVILTSLCMYILRQYDSAGTVDVISVNDRVTHVLVTGGAGYIGFHATLRLLQDGFRVTIVDNLSRGNLGAVKMLQGLFPEPGRLHFLNLDLDDNNAVNEVFSRNAIDVVMHFAAVAYVGESMVEPLRYYHNITSSTLGLIKTMMRHRVHKLIYSSTCATYGEPDVMPIKESTPQVPINPYGKAKKMAEDMILDYTKSNNQLAVMNLRTRIDVGANDSHGFLTPNYIVHALDEHVLHVIRFDYKGRLGEAPRPELRAPGRISGACFDAAMGVIPNLKVQIIRSGTEDGTCVQDYIHVTDLIDAHVKALNAAKPGKPGIYNVATGKGVSVKDFVEACKSATSVNITITYMNKRPGDYAEVYSDPTKIKSNLNWTAKGGLELEESASKWLR